MSRTSADITRKSQPWAAVLVLFWITSVVEAICISQVYAFMPLYLQTLGLTPDLVPRWVGTLSALVFLVGLPLVPFWGVWADKYSRKAVIIRSSVVEGLMLVLVALSREPWQLGASFALSGFQLGNSGVMLATLREVAPSRRIGTAIAAFGTTWPVGSAIGPAIGGLMMDGFGLPIWSIYAFSAVLSFGTAAMLAAGFREVRPQSVPAGRTFDLAVGAIRGILVHPVTRGLFLLYGTAFLSRQMSNPFLPLVVQAAHGGGAGLASSIALVVGTAALVGGVISPLGGALSDRVGFRPVLTASMIACGLLLALMPFAPGVAALAVANAAFAALAAVVGAMVFGLLATETPPESRSATLNLAYLPLYLAGIVGPAVGGMIAATGVSYVFVLSGLVSAGGAVLAGRRRTPAE